MSLTEFSYTRLLGSASKVLETGLLPTLGIVAFLFAWHLLAVNVNTSLGQFPGPSQVLEQVISLQGEHVEQRQKETEFYQRQEIKNAKKLAKNPAAQVKTRDYTGKATFLDQIFTSLYTVLFGFFVASVIAVPLGVICGLSEKIYQALNPVIQIFKPVSPLAWLPLVTMVVSAVYVSEDPMFQKSFLTSAITVALCCLWPTVINTTVGVAGLDRELVNVGKVIKLSPMTNVIKIVLPSSLPMIFTGLRLSLATGWMVLIAAEMLAQNPGLGKFIWDEFQNGSSDSLARIMVAVLTIGFIGFLLDRVMLFAQGQLSWDKQALLR